MHIPIDIDTKILKFDDLLFALVGGDEIVDMLVKHHVDGWSLSKIAEVFDQGCKSSVHNKIVRARIKLRQVGLFPAAWETEAAASL